MHCLPARSDLRKGSETDHQAFHPKLGFWFLKPKPFPMFANLRSRWGELRSFLDPLTAPTWWVVKPTSCNVPPSLRVSHLQPRPPRPWFLGSSCPRHSRGKCFCFLPARSPWHQLWRAPAPHASGFPSHVGLVLMEDSFHSRMSCAFLFVRNIQYFSELDKVLSWGRKHP